jgi:hypothetical protein
LLCLFFDAEDEGDVSPERRLIFNCVISQKIELSIRIGGVAAVVRTEDLINTSRNVYYYAN